MVDRGLPSRRLGAGGAHAPYLRGGDASPSEPFIGDPAALATTASLMETGDDCPLQSASLVRPANPGGEPAPTTERGADVVLWRTTLDGRWLIDISASVERLLGYPRWRWFERNFWIEHVYFADREWVMEQIAANRNAGRPFAMHYRMITASSEAVWVRETVRVEEGRCVCGVMRVDSREGSLLEEVRTTKARLHESMSRHFRLREEVSRRLSSEIHDDLGQFLTISIRDAELLRCELESVEPLPASIAPRIDRLEEHLRTTLHRLRLMASTLRPPALDEGFVAALNHHVRMVHQATGIGVDVDIDTDALPEPAVEIQLFRVVQEALSNIIRHSEATEVQITLKSYHEGSILRVADDGCGFDPTRVQRGVGLATIRERVELIGGHVTMESAPHRGTVVKAVFPPRVLEPSSS